MPDQDPPGGNHRERRDQEDGGACAPTGWTTAPKMSNAGRTRADNAVVERVRGNRGLHHRGQRG
jgi:hypothetical protein